jgi:hypothetical protein
MNCLKAVHNWFKNNKPFKDRAVFRLERKIALRRVVGKLKADLIQDLMAENRPDIQKGDKKYPGAFQLAVTDFMDGMSEEDLAEMKVKQAEWQANGPPMKIRLQLVNPPSASCAPLTWFEERQRSTVGRA